MNTIDSAYQLRHRSESDERYAQWLAGLQAFSFEFSEAPAASSHPAIGQYVYKPVRVVTAVTHLPSAMVFAVDILRFSRKSRAGTFHGHYLVASVLSAALLPPHVILHAEILYESRRPFAKTQKVKSKYRELIKYLSRLPWEAHKVSVSEEWYIQRAYAAKIYVPGVPGGEDVRTSGPCRTGVTHPYHFNALGVCLCGVDTSETLHGPIHAAWGVH